MCSNHQKNGTRTEYFQFEYCQVKKNLPPGKMPSFIPLYYHYKCSSVIRISSRSTKLLLYYVKYSIFIDLSPKLSINERKNQIKMFGDLLPGLRPNVEDQLLRCLAREVEIYSKDFKGTRCFLCPFRVLSRSSYLRRHLSYHCKENMYLADKRSPQLYVIRAIFDHRLVTASISLGEFAPSDLLKQSAALILD